MSLPALKAHLELMVANVMDKVTEQQETKGAAVALDRHSLMRYIESAMPQESQYVDEYLRIDYAGGLGPFFSKLPRELRDQIFSDLIVSGNPQFMGVSRGMKIEGEALVYKKGIYRLICGYDVDRFRFGVLKGNCPAPIPKIANNIRNLSITVKVQDFSFSTPGTGHLAFQYVDMLMGWPLRYRDTGTCWMRGCCNYTAILLWSIVHIARGLTAFDTVELHFETDLKHENCSKLWQIERITDLRTESRRNFEPFLRQEIVESEVDSLRLVFHPRKAGKEKIREADHNLRNVDAHTYMKTQMGRDCLDWSQTG